MIRKSLFWLHLSVGAVAGVVILIMSVTGVLLAYQRQIIRWADREYRHSPTGAQNARLSPEALLEKARVARRAVPTALTLHSDSEEPAAAEFGRDTVVYLSPETGEVLGEGSRSVRAFFRETENWHRWLAVGIESRETARGVTGYANLLFLGLLGSGFYLWIPKRWTLRHLRPALWFRRGLTGKARDWNWHNTIGIWCVVPLFVIVASAVVMSFPWANSLVYRMTGTEAPVQNGSGGRGGPGRGDSAATADARLDGLNSLWQRAEQQTPGWTIITMRMPASPKSTGTVSDRFGRWRAAGSSCAAHAQSQVRRSRALGALLRQQCRAAFAILDSLFAHRRSGRRARRNHRPHSFSRWRVSRMYRSVIGNSPDGSRNCPSEISAAAVCSRS